MTPSYVVRLLLLSSASFFLVHLLLGALAAWIAPAAVRRAEKMNPARAANVLLTLRLMPVGLSAIIVFALSIPSYLRFEPTSASEQAGAFCIAAAILGLLFSGVAVFRTASAFVRSSHSENQIAGVALAGILHPRLLISDRARSELSADQLEVALRHEDAHRASFDNLKRLLLLLAPGLFPQQRALERVWAKYTEWAADDRAIGGDPDRAVTLAEALVCVARIQTGAGVPQLATSLVEPEEDLSIRVDRLLNAVQVNDPPVRTGLSGICGSATLLAIIAAYPGALRLVHSLLERLLD
jgi:hypothetical protein